MKTMIRIYAAILLLFMTSCAKVGIADQAVLSRPVMSASPAGARIIGIGLTSQIESGRASTSSAAGAGCSACH